MKITILITLGIIGLYLVGLHMIAWAVIVIGITLFLISVAVDLVRAISRFFRRPTYQLHYHESHPDPTRPDDEHPLIQLNRQNFRRQK